MRFSKLLAKLALIGLGILAALLLMEGWFRLNGITGFQDRLSVYEFDDILGWKTKPDSKAFRSTRNFAHYNYYGPQGFPVDKDNWEESLSVDTPSIAIIGDSLTEGYYLPYENTFTYLIDQKVPDRQVINLGVSGYAPDQYLLSARRHLDDYNVTDLIVIFFPGNDVRDVKAEKYFTYAKPKFGPSLEEPINTPLEKFGRGERKGVLRQLNDRSALARTLNPVIFKYFGGMLGINVPSALPAYHDEAGMRKALQLIKQIDVEFPVERFTVYYAPQYEEILEPNLFAHNITLFLKLCDEFNVRCTTPERFIQNVSDPADLYIPNDGHFSKLGASLFADEIVELLGVD